MSGRPKQAMYVLLRLIGAAVEFAGHLRGLRRSIDVAGKVRMLCGMLSSKGGGGAACSSSKLRKGDKR